jgi:hypothetical protein
MAPLQSSALIPAEEESSDKNQQQTKFDLTGHILRKKNVNSNFIKIAIQQPNHAKSTIVYIPRDDNDDSASSTVVYNPVDVKFLYLEATIRVKGCIFNNQDGLKHHVEQCTLIKCAPNVKMIKEILSLPNCISYASMFNMEVQNELQELLTKEKSQKAIVMTIMERLSGKKKAVTWRPGKIKKKSLEILQQKEAEGNDASNTTWQLCQPCQSLNDKMSFDVRSETIVNLPEGSDDVMSAHGKLTRREYLDTKKNNQTQWFVERIRTFHRKEEDPWRFLDVGGGRGDLAVQIAMNYSNSHVVVVDCNESSIAAGREYAARCNVEHRIDFIHQNFADYCDNYIKGVSGRVDVIVALHSCGDLSDLALRFAQQHDCTFVICPCCYPKRYLAPFKPFWHSLCNNEEEVDSLSRMVEMDNESRNNESRRAMLVINSMRRRAFEGHVTLEEFSNKISKRNIVLVRDSVL